MVIVVCSLLCSEFLEDEFPPTAVFPESTLVACPLYEKLGFRAEKNISMVIEGLGDDGKPIVYEEKLLVFRQE
jgi:hypothetical protein